jgi:hypothetical protein
MNFTELTADEPVHALVVVAHGCMASAIRRLLAHVRRTLCGGLAERAAEFPSTLDMVFSDAGCRPLRRKVHAATGRESSSHADHD